MSLDTDLNHWLNQATRGLPTEVSSVIRRELETHYEDALAEYQASGISFFDAHESALAELGDVRAISRALHNVHLAHRRYWKAAFASIAPSIVFLLIVFSQVSPRQTAPPEIFDYSGLFGLLSLFAVLYGLDSFKVLLAGRYQIDRPTSMVMWSFLSVTLLSVISQWLFNNHVSLVVNDPLIVTGQLFSDASVPLERLLNSLNVISVLLLGIGWIYLSDRLIGDNLYGLVTPLRYLFLLNGVVIASSGLATLLGLLNANVISVIALVIVGTSKCAVWTLLFFRAAYQASKRPVQTA